LLDRKRFEPGIRKLLRFHEQRLPRERQGFKEWWQRWQQLGGEKAFAALLHTPAALAQRMPLLGGNGAGMAAPLGGNGAASDGMTGTAPGGATDGSTAADGTTGPATPP
jgi:hypothetical protein